MEVNKNKMKEIIHYIIGRCGNKDNVGKTVLYKILYFADFDHFELTEKSITNETYRKYPNGPVPIHFNELKDELIAEGKISEEEEHIFPGSTKKRFRYSSLKALNNKYTSKKELDQYNQVIKRLSHMTADEISDYSHDDIPWRATKDYDEVEYELVFYRNEPYSVRDNE